MAHNNMELQAMALTLHCLEQQAIIGLCNGLITFGDTQSPMIALHWDK